MKPLVSVIIPVYNIEKYVGKCLGSVCGQGYDDLEIIVVDDGSTDDSGKICDEFKKKDGRVKVYHNKNRGLSAARNFGISKARGEFIALVDGDDYVKKNYISEMVEALDDETDVVVCGYNDILPQEKELNGHMAAAQLLVEQESLDIVAWNKLYSKKMFDDIRYPEGEKYEDSLTTYKILALARKVKYIPKSLYVYVVRCGSIMNTAKIEERLAVRERAAREAVEYFNGDKNLRQAAKVAVLTARYAFVDAAVRGEINKKYYTENKKWILAHKKEYANNKYMTKKLKVYNFMMGGIFYKIFRKIRHE
jgi:glycosyltransferase involved in cell wall biosynthesis